MSFSITRIVFLDKLKNRSGSYETGWLTGSVKTGVQPVSSGSIARTGF